MQTRELVLRILRLNLIPAPRVLTPGPATKFPVLHVDEKGREQIVHSLDDARVMSASGDFFVEILPVSGTARVVVSGLSVVSHCGEAAANLSARAAYALGLDSGVATVGFGPGGPWVIRVDPTVRSLGRNSNEKGGLIEFLGATSEFLAVDQRTGVPVHAFFTVDISPEGEPIFIPALSRPSPGSHSAPDQAHIKWISSPMPYPDLPLTMRLKFRGCPTPGFLRVLDRTAALPAMLASPLYEVRERNGSPEGILGSYRTAEEGCFEYLTVPSLLFNPDAVRGVCEAALAASRGRGDAACHTTTAEAEPYVSPITGADSWARDLDGIYRFQRAYYHADKAFVSAHLGLEPGPIHAGHDPFDDFRAAWGFEVPRFTTPCLTVWRDGAVRGGDRLTTDEGIDAGGGVEVTAGARAVSVRGEGILAPDALDDERFMDRSPAWAPSTMLRPNPVLAGRLSLPGDVLYRATGHSSRLRVGPVVGIMAPGIPGPRRFGIETDRFKRMALLGREMGLLVYVFFPDEVDWNASLVKAWTYRDRRGWTSEPLPLPDVVYDRHIPDAALSGQGDVSRAFLGKYPDARFLNSLPFVRVCRDKMEAHRILAADSFVRRHLPETLEVDNPAQATDFISGRARTFLKLRGGTGSKGVVFVENLGSRYRIVKREKGSLPEITVASGCAELESAVSCVVTGAGGEYIAQEGIDLAPLPDGAGSAFEVRVIYQKGGIGRWVRTGMVCRLNPTAEKFVIPGQEIHRRPGELLAAVFPGRVSEVEEEVRRTARMIPPLLERASGSGGEVSVDFGIDRDGKPWLIEVNSKPATLFRDVAAFRLRELSLLRVLNYAVALFHRRDEEVEE